MAYAIAPNGKMIVGTAEQISSTAYLHADQFERNADGKISFEHNGETKEYDSETVEQDGKTVFVDAEGGEWTEDQIKLVEEMPRR